MFKNYYRDCIIIKSFPPKNNFEIIVLKTEVLFLVCSKLNPKTTDQQVGLNFKPINKLYWDNIFIKIIESLQNNSMFKVQKMFH